MAEILNKLGKKLKKDLNKSVLIILPSMDKKVIRATRNIPKIKSIMADSLNIYDVLSCHYLLMPKESIKIIQETYTK